MAENTKSVLSRKEIKDINFPESETKHFVRSPNRNAKNEIFRRHQFLEKNMILGITQDEGKKGSPIWSGWMK